MPSTTPLVTVPTACPCCAGVARVAACATITCTMTAISPTMASATSSTAQPQAMPTATNASAETSNWPMIRRLRSMRSPNGTTSSKPSA
ncbi:hypothetical protein D3C77_544690 [compost metagenome]